MNLEELIRSGRDSAVALSAPGRAATTFSDLRDLVDRVRADLNRHGIGAGDRVAIVLPNGPEMATAFLAAACTSSAAPLNPSYTAEEFDFFLTDIGAKALIVAEGSQSPAIGVAEQRGIAIVRLVGEASMGAGRFSLSFAGSAGAPVSGQELADDAIALLLHTSGTTSRPKLVPLTHRNVCASARNVCATLAFGPKDRGLNIMPLFHIHGLVAGLLAPLLAGSEVVCTPGFNALKFFDWFAEMRPTWYSAVPSMHQAILSRASRHRDLIAACRLRFIRSSSAAMPGRVMEELEQIFEAPLIEAYGMTEAAHQMTSSPLPPGRRQSGTVGLAAGPEVAIIDEAGDLLPAGQVGEIAIRGDNVMAGYEANVAANLQSFTAQKWFRTGDQGLLSADGYLSITGRLKEIINRGGEKISPREVDEVVMDHPSIAQCVTFAMPSSLFGEEVASAVVLRPDATLDEVDLRKFAAKRLAPFKVPSRIIVLDELPKGPTGKLQRIGLAERLGVSSE